MTYDESYLLLIFSLIVFIISFVQVLAARKNQIIWLVSFALSFSVGVVTAFFAYQDYDSLFFFLSVIFFLTIFVFLLTYNNFRHEN